MHRKNTSTGSVGATSTGSARALIVVFTLLLMLLTHVSSAFAISFLPEDLSIPFSKNKTEWINTACQHATAGGCEYFRAHEAGPAWLALNAMNAASINVHFKEEAAGFGSDLTLWHLELNVITSSGESQTHDVYATILTQNGQALLDRIIVFDQTLIATLE